MKKCQNNGWTVKRRVQESNAIRQWQPLAQTVAYR